MRRTTKALAVLAVSGIALGAGAAAASADTVDSTVSGGSLWRCQIFCVRGDGRI
ncbi:hypothetical protein [Sinomonas terrae]|uniref:Uncharacterized protein n=1 Tax=Sinomonas terrae TaxID=2908838 RepID=A0ABS9U6V4_9MICC|nr:hypothetical protein [Sinomonas terrae]MCH6472092.1 hypothetical protein [Sinomonas terrae]